MRGLDDLEAWFPRGLGPHPPPEPSLVGLGTQHVDGPGFAWKQLLETSSGQLRTKGPFCDITSRDLIPAGGSVHTSPRVGITSRAQF